MKALRKPLSLLMAMLMCLGVFVGTGTTAFAAGETMTTYMIDLPRASDPNKAGWGHPALNFLGGWSTGENDSFSVHTQDAFNGRAIYCIEPGVGVNTGDQYTGRGEDFWDNYPSNLNPTIPPNTVKEYIGRIMTYGWQGNASTSWMSGNPEDASKIAGYIATQLLVWETVVGERDSQFNHVDARAQGKNNMTEYISADHPLYSQIFSQYSAIESAVKRHTMLPSFFSSTADAGAYELKWDGQQYSLTLTDTNGVLGDYTFSSSTTGLNFLCGRKPAHHHFHPGHQRLCDHQGGKNLCPAQRCCGLDRWDYRRRQAGLCHLRGNRVRLYGGLSESGSENRQYEAD